MSNVTSNSGSNFNVFTYYYNYQISTSEFSSHYTAVHEDELAMVFAQPLSNKSQPFLTTSNKWPPTSSSTYGSIEKTIASYFVNYWSNFVKTGNVNGNGYTNWPAWTSAAGSFLNMTGTTASSFNPTSTSYSMSSDVICQMLYPQWNWN